MTDILGTTLQEAVSESSEILPALRSINRQTRLAGLLIVLAVAVPPFLIASTMRLLGVAGPSLGPYLQYRYFNALLIEITSLALLSYVLHQNRQSLAEIGLKFQAADIGHGLWLIIGAQLLFPVARWMMIWLYVLQFRHAPPPFTSPLVGTGLAASLVFAAINPFFEELIVRGFLISETIFLTGSAVIAATLSVLLQTAYHLYQGFPNAVGHALVFIMFSVYYVKTRKLWPIIFTHFWLDFSAVVLYFLRVQHH